MSTEEEMKEPCFDDSKLDTRMLKVYGSPIIEIVRSRKLLSEADIETMEEFCNKDTDISKESLNLPVIVMTTLIHCITEKDELFNMVNNFCCVVLKLISPTPDMRDHVLFVLLQSDLSLRQQELIAHICAGTIVMASEDERTELFLSLTTNLISLINSRSAIEEESAVFISLEFIRIILNHISKPSLSLRYAMSYYLLTLLACGFVDGVFQKRSTNRTRVLSFLNKVNLPFLSLVDYNYTFDHLKASPKEFELCMKSRVIIWPSSSAMLAYIVLSQHYPYFNFPKVYSPQFIYSSTADAILSLLLSENATTKQSALSLSSTLLSAIPPHSFHLPICTYSFKVLHYCGLVTTFSILSLAHYYTFVMLGNRKEDDASIVLTKDTSFFAHLTKFIGIFDKQCIFPFLIAILRFYIDENEELKDDNVEGICGAPNEEEIKLLFLNEKQVIHRGEVNVDEEIISGSNSLLQLNFNDTIACQLMSVLNSMNGKIEHYELIRFTSFIDILCYFILKEIEQLPAEIDIKTSRYLKIICRLFMNNRLPDHISYLQLEAVIMMLRIFNEIAERYYSDVIDYIMKHQVYLVQGLQRIANNIRKNNKVVMSWYIENSIKQDPQEQRAVNAIRMFYQYLSLMSYSYNFSVEI